jgi:formate dehydrogenase major subunit
MTMRERNPKLKGVPPDKLRLSIQPEQAQKSAPCQAGCPNSGDIRGWIGIIAQHDKLGLSPDEAFDRAWAKVAAVNPFPATLGRICPHPCETNCTRASEDGAVSINALERFVGDWGLERGLPLPAVDTANQPESVGVIGSGPAGMSFAYQMRRYGYPVTIYERNAEPGGVLHYGIPDFRLPEDVPAAEIRRVLDLGIDLRLGVEVGRDIKLDELRSRHDVVFLGMGAQRSRRLGIPGEHGPGSWSGIDYLRLSKCGQDIDLGHRVAVIGGGNTAIDAARTARRAGADVILVYRRTREEMPAIASEIEDATTEGIRFRFLAAPNEIVREGDAITGIVLQQMELGEPDETGRRRPVPVADATDSLPVDSVIVAASQSFDSSLVEHIRTRDDELITDSVGGLGDHVWAGGDDLGLGIAGLAISQGREAAEAAHAELRAQPLPDRDTDRPIERDDVKTGFYAARPPLTPPRLPAAAWLEQPEAEIDRTITREEALQEASRCYSCGLCFGCQQCWMYCNAGGFVHLAEAAQGNYFALNTEVCEGCGKCIEVCPSGFLSIRRQPGA